VDCLLRPANESDREFLYTLHCTTMRLVIEQTWGWDEEWQRRDFDRRFRSYAASVIELEGAAVGGVLLDRTPVGVDIVELQILPEYQGKGIGTSVVRSVIEDAAHEGFPVTLSVVHANGRAKRLYERLGFQVTASEEPFIRMRYMPQTSL
jgi:ribosomal protein S18 acetylase RimI-like enzyme